MVKSMAMSPYRNYNHSNKMSQLKSLAKDTAVYGLSSIVGRFLNWCLVPLYVYLFPAAEYGIVSYLYSFTAVALVILNYGMETGFFRYASREPDPQRVYTTSLGCVAITSILFTILVSIFISPISTSLLLPKHPMFVWMLAVTVAIDAFSNIPFAYLRFRNKAMRFAGIKLCNVFLNIGLNIFFLLCCPWIAKHAPGAIGWWYEPPGGDAFGIGWIFLANLLSSLCVLLLLTPALPRSRWSIDSALLKKMLKYSWPLLILGVAGILSQNMGQMIIPYIFKGHEEAARAMVGIYGANIKIAIVMVMFTQAFRYAYEPFIFARAKAEGEDRSQAYCDAMKYFIIFGLLIFLGVMYFMPILKHFVAPSYWSGLQVVPVMMVAELCFGVFFNLSLWYKLTDRTQWGMYFSLICFVMMLALNLWLVPLIGIPEGYMGSAWAALIAYFAVMLISYFVGRRYYPLPYALGRIGAYTLLAAILWGSGIGIDTLLGDGTLPAYLLKSLLLCIYILAILKYEKLHLPGIPTSRKREAQ